VLPGEYELTVRFREQMQRATVRVLPDPRSGYDEAAARSKDAALQQRDEIQRELADALQRVARHRRDVELVEQRLKLEPKPQPGAEDPLAALRKAVATATKDLKEFETKLWGPSDVQGVTRGSGLVRDVSEQTGRVTGTDDAPNATELQALEGPVQTFRAAVEQSGIALLGPAAK
jgi:hypothetical protein